MQAFDVATAADWEAAWRWLSPKLENKKVLALTGNLGAGKTSFAKAIIKAHQCELPVTSPTFSIVQEYTTPHGTIAHFDLYRLSGIEEVLDIGFEEYLEKSILTLVEWPAVAKQILLAEETCFVAIEHLPEGGRRLLAL